MTNAPVPPGWYPYPGGEGALRWWDGSQWREPDPPAVQQPLPAGVGTNTWAAWTIAALPALSLLLSVLLGASGAYTRFMREALAPTRNLSVGSGGELGSLTPSYDAASVAVVVASQLVGLVVIVAGGLLALRDQRILRDRGVVRPFPWGWGFYSPVYVIGRAVVVRRRVRGSLAPLWLYAVLFVLSLVVAFGVTGSAIAAGLRP